MLALLPLPAVDPWMILFSHTSGLDDDPRHCQERPWAFEVGVWKARIAHQSWRESLLRTFRLLDDRVLQHVATGSPEGCQIAAPLTTYIIPEWKVCLNSDLLDQDRDEWSQRNGHQMMPWLSPKLHLGRGIVQHHGSTLQGGHYTAYVNLGPTLEEGSTRE